VARRRAWETVAVLALYGAVSALFFGLRLWLEPGRQYVGAGSDPQIFIWDFAWWPHAIGDGINPFVTHAIWSPSGVNLTWATSVPGLALPFAPLTVLFGAVASYNTAAILLPALAAWTAFLLCRHLTGALWPSLVGGYLYGFSGYMLGQETSHMHAAAIFLLPLIALVVLRYLEGEIGGWSLSLRLAPLLGLPLLIWTELSLSGLAALFGAVVLAAIVWRDLRPRLRSLVWPVTRGYLLAAVLTSPFVYFALKAARRTSFVFPYGYPADLANYVLPTSLNLVGWGWANTLAKHFAAHDAENGAFLGVSLAIVVLYARRYRRTREGKFLLAALAVAFVASLGVKLTVFGERLVPLPWNAIARLPLFNNTLPDRLVLYVWLGVAVVVALWTSRQQGALRWILPVLAVATILPSPGRGDAWATDYAVPPFFTDPAYRSCLARDENVLPQPIGEGGDAMLWQVKSGFRFRMAGGRISVVPPTQFMHPSATIQRVSVGYDPGPDYPQLLREYFAAKGVTSVIVDRRFADTWTPPLDTLAARHDVGGVVLYHVGNRGPGC
jgi:hypothetical protein